LRGMATVELIDVYTPEGTPAGYYLPRSEIHAKGHWHKVVHSWIVNSSGQLIMQKRAAIKESHPNLWDISSAGHISAGDTSIISAHRELSEELGLDIPIEKIEYLFSSTQQFVLHEGKYIDNELVDVYLIQMDVDLTTLTLQEEEVSEVKYVHYSELEKMILNNDPTIVPVRNPDYAELFFAELRKRLK